jgi:starch synthase
VRIDILTREFAPDSYGGAGTHVDSIVPLLRQSLTIRVHCFGEPRADGSVTAYRAPAALFSRNIAIQAAAIAVAMADAVAGASAVHSNTWYTNFGGHLAKIFHNIPHIMTAHSLEPRRPWKADSLGAGYRLSSYFEQSAMHEADRIIAVSRCMRDDIVSSYPDVDPDRIAVIPSGVDATLFAPSTGIGGLERYSVRPGRATVVCVARITPQKGLSCLLRASEYFPAGTQLVIVADTADNEALRAEFSRQVAQTLGRGVDLVWIRDPIPKSLLASLLGYARVFVCPSVYEPLGIVNLEAMSCGTAVVATATGGIPELVVDGVTGFLVSPEDRSPPSGDPNEDNALAKEFALRVNELLSKPDLADSMGREGRRRVLSHFGWERVASGVRDVYLSAIERRPLPARLR